MTFFNKYQNNKIDKGNFSEFKRNVTIESNLLDNYKLEYDFNSEASSALEKIKIAEEEIKSQIAGKSFDFDPFFDSDLIKNLDILYNFISNYIPDYDSYYNNDGNSINGQAYLDALDILKNETPVSIDEIIHSQDTITGVMNDTKINVENGYQIDEMGNVYNPSRQIIFSPGEPTDQIKFIDLLNEKLVTTNGIRLDLPKDFVEENFINNSDVPVEFKSKYIMKKQEIEFANNEKNGYFYEIKDEEKEIYGMVKGVPIYDDEKELMRLEVEELYTGDIFEDISKQNPIDFKDQIKNYAIETNKMNMCNFKDIPYGELNSLLMWGGGERGVKPLASNEISSKDIQFKPDGTVFYSGENSTVSTNRAGCPSKTFKTGHVCMYSESNKIGLKRSIIQYIFGFCNTFGIFNANIPPLIGFKKFKVFPGLCIGGLLEKILCGWQEKISKRINDMFQCVPTSMPSDSSESGFENETFAYGCTLKTIEELDTIKSCKVGDRYVIETVNTDITGNKDIACGVFIYDPQGYMENFYFWKYKHWRGKPFNPYSNNSVITKYENIFENPIISDLIQETNSLGTDSITRKLMELQYAFFKKQALLAVNDVKYSMDELINNTIDEVIGKLTNQLSSFLVMKHFHEQFETDDEDLSEFNKYEKIGYISEFQKHFQYLVANKVLKPIPLDKCKKERIIFSEDKNGMASSQKKIEYYDFAGYNSNEYLVPSRKNVEEYDLLMFSKMFIPSEQIIEALKSNIGYLEALQSDTSAYKNIKTIKDYIKKNSSKISYEKNVEDNLRYINADLNYNGFEPEAFEQVKKRCYFTIEKADVFGGVL